MATYVSTHTGAQIDAGIDAAILFEAVYGSTTYAEITAAYNAGRTVIAKKGTTRYQLTLIAGTAITFAWTNSATKTLATISVSNADVWSENTYNIGDAIDAAQDASSPAIVKTVSGAVASFSDGADDVPVKSLIAQINAAQDLNGYSNPWPAGGGKNKLNPHLYAGGVYNPTVGDTLALTDSSTQLTANADSSVYTLATSVSWDTWTLLAPVVVGDTYKLSGSIASTALRTTIGYLDASYEVLSKANDTAASQTWNTTLTPTDDAAYCFITFSNGGTASETITLTNPQFEAGSSATSYAPYANVCPISGYTGANVMSAGAQLAPPFTRQGYYAGTNGNFVSDVNWISTVMIPVKPNTRYRMISDFSSRWAGSTTFDADGNYLGQIGELAAHTPRAIDVLLTATPANCTQIGISIAGPSGTSLAPADVTDLKLVEEALYDVYSVSWSDEAGTVYGGELNVTTGVLTVDTDRVDMGTLTWTENTTLITGQRVFVSNDIAGRLGGSLLKGCEALRVFDARGQLSSNDTAIAPYNTISAKTVVARADAYADAAAFTAAVNGLYLYFATASTTVYTLTPQEIASLLGVNNVWSTANGDTTVDYVADTALALAEILPAAPGTDGTYTLTCTVSGGVATYSWEA